MQDVTILELIRSDHRGPCHSDFKIRLLWCTLCGAAIEDSSEAAVSEECGDQGVSWY